MSHQKQQFKATALLLVLHVITAKAAKTSARPVHEVINEQARIDDKKETVSPGLLPYGNPLAGNLLQNVKLHAQNQQAMFNAERVRQHRAQIQRWTKAPAQIDSYMKAYQESQESHQLAVEQQQANSDKKQTPKPTRRQNARQDGLKRIKSLEPTKITKEDAITEKNRSHRSHGSVEYHQYLQPQRYKTIYVSPTSYENGVTIKPNGLANLDDNDDDTKLYTEALPSHTQYVYPKQYSQMQAYESAHDIEMLNALLKKTPQDQLTELNALIQTEKHNEDGKESVGPPMDLYFYLKDPSLTHHVEHSIYEQIPQSYVNAYGEDTEIKDHTPITEEVDDIEDPNRDNKLRIFSVQPPAPAETTKTNNLFQPAVASQITDEQRTIKPEYVKENNKPSYEALKYEKPLTYYVQDTKNQDTSERYSHHNAQPSGVQHLNEDGTGVSAYGNENLHYAANYEFGYRVRDHETGNDFGHHELKKDGTTNGQYHVLLPDGRMQQVKYSAGPEGFHADISYDHVQ